MPDPLAQPLEDERLRRLYATGLVDAPPSPRFDRITRLARRLLDADTAVLALLDRDREVFLSHAGRALVPRGRGRSWSTHVLDGQTKTVDDCRLDLAFHHHPDVVGRFGLRFVTINPIVTDSGHVLGALCILDAAPRQLDDEELDLLDDLVGMATTAIHINRAAEIDGVTGLHAQQGFLGIAEYALASGFRNQLSSTLVVLELHGLDGLHDHSPINLEEALAETSLLLTTCFRGSDVVGRLAPATFGVLLTGAGPGEVDIPLTRLEALVREANALRDGPWVLTFSVGYAGYDPSEHPCVEALIEDAQAAMYDIAIGQTA